MIKVNSYIVSYIVSTYSVLEKLIPICVETLKYVQTIDKRLKVLQRSINAEESVNIFDDILPINSIQNLERLEKNLEMVETKANFVS